MFDKIGQAAEKMAIDVSRRAFLGRLGKAALAVGAILGFASTAEAGHWVTCCYYSDYSVVCLDGKKKCPRYRYNGEFEVVIVGSRTVTNCSQC